MVGSLDYIKYKLLDRGIILKMDSLVNSRAVKKVQSLISISSAPIKKDVSSC